MNKIQIDYRYDDSVAFITLNNGKGNILDKDMMAELQQALQVFAQQDNLKLLVFRGAGHHFSFGAAVEEHRKERAGEMLRDFHQIFYAMAEHAIPAIALISGQCLGGGLEIALMCNVMFADKSARLGQPEIVLGVFPPPASILLPQKIGLARAEELLISGRTMKAEEAHAIGLLHALYDDPAAMEAGVNDWITKHILPKSASSLRYAVKAARALSFDQLRTFLPRMETLYLNQLMETHDANEGIEAFLENRQPVWDNH